MPKPTAVNVLDERDIARDEDSVLRIKLAAVFVLVAAAEPQMTRGFDRAEAATTCQLGDLMRNVLVQAQRRQASPLGPP